MKVGSLTAVAPSIMLVVEDIEWPKWAVKQYIVIVPNSQSNTEMKYLNYFNICRRLHFQRKSTPLIT